MYSRYSRYPHPHAHIKCSEHGTAIPRRDKLCRTRWIACLLQCGRCGRRIDRRIPDITTCNAAESLSRQKLGTYNEISAATSKNYSLFPGNLLALCGQRPLEPNHWQCPHDWACGLMMRCFSSVPPSQPHSPLPGLQERRRPFIM